MSNKSESNVMYVVIRQVNDGIGAVANSGYSYSGDSVTTAVVGEARHYALLDDAITDAGKLDEEFGNDHVFFITGTDIPEGKFVLIVSEKGRGDKYLSNAKVCTTFEREMTYPSKPAFTDDVRNASVFWTLTAANDAIKNVLHNQRGQVSIASFDKELNRGDRENS